MHKIIISAFFLLSFSSNANETEVLTVDRVVPNNLELSFPNDRRIKPKSSDFELVNYVVMSNELGERWAVVTVRNSSTGGRSLENGHLMALFANGDRKSPLEFKVSFEGKETQSITVSFGENKFPILTITTAT
ncbi:MAG: hypothetical protein COA76_03340 [Moritella sp.]|uniref:hypothetical protein n=1 Tax=Moritella sp. TaxID=78556 RepID=UPI000C0E1AE3|nr:hypothetical protein [Moritella sp.]MBL1418118.1 hypothetical protein [Moritella sp.]PHR89602.1 MAG: hypothetical protein COA76_03340 [Moritella sp.]